MEALKIVFPYLARHKLRIAAGAIAVFISTTFAVVQPYILQVAINGLQRHFSLQLLTFDGLLYVGAGAGQAIFLFVQRSTVNRVSRYTEYDLRNDLFTHLQELDQSFFEEMHTGDLMARLTNDLSAVRQFLGQSLITLLSTGIMLIYVVVLMLQISVHLAIIAFIVLPFVSLSIWLIGRSMHRRYRKVQDQFGAISTYAQENFSGIRVVKAFVQESHEIDAFNKANREYVDRALRYQLVSGIMWPLMTLVMGIATALVLYVGGNEVADGTINIGEFVQFIAYLGMLTYPMISLGWMLNLVQQGAASATRIAEVLDRSPRIRDSGLTLPLDTIEGRIEFRNVGVRRGDRWVFRDVSFTVEPGESLAIVGMTGTGKSTLMNLVPRVLEPDEGEVLIDGVDVRRQPLTNLRAAVGYIPQDTFLFSATLAENTTFGNREATRDQIEEALAVSQLSKDLEQFPRGLDTVVGERGVSLSGGQKQRAALARAIMRDPTILILDDAMSSVDTNTQNEILAGLRRVMKGRTTLITSMRISTIKDADQIVVLHEGTIVERGKHRDLVRENGLYARMYRRELLQQELEVE